MNEIAVVKPDHIGDLVLSLPAMRALKNNYGAFDLFASPSNTFIKDHFLPDIPFYPAVFAHLQKNPTRNDHRDIVKQLKNYKLVIFLRDDDVMRSVASELSSRSLMVCNDMDLHETIIQKNAIADLVGEYSRAKMFPEQPKCWPMNIATIGLSISAGFFTNKLPALHWVRLARRLISSERITIKIIGGPQELVEAKQIASILGLGQSDIIIGDHDINLFYEKLGTCDIIVGTDSGTLHLASVIKPLLGIFTASPWRRFSPFGKHNRVIFADVPCSPCIQFSKSAFNGCLSRECSTLIEPEYIHKAIFEKTEVSSVALSPLVRLVSGPSHIEAFS